MTKNLDSKPQDSNREHHWLASMPQTPPQVPNGGSAMRHMLQQHLYGVLNGQVVLHCPSAHRGLEPTAAGHFHLAPELFVQVSGHTRFVFPQGHLTVQAGQAALLPPQLVHSEVVGPDDQGPFCNIVIYAESGALSSHVASELQPGLPSIQHLEVRHHAAANQVHRWLMEAAATQALQGEHPCASVQQRALVVAALASVLQVLDTTDQAAKPEPALVSKVRVWVQNHLGDQALSVQGLAQQSGCTADHLSQAFHRHTGEHLVGYITRLRMERAAHLLAEHEMAIKAVAWACGYSSASYFIRNFRQRYGTTPLAWREQAASNAKG
jgi:AraC-like DNA-binding protein